MLTLTRCPFHPVLLQWHVKDPSHSAKSAGGTLHLNMQTPLTQWSQSWLTVLSGHSAGIYQGNKLTHNSSENTWLQLSHLAEPLWTDSGLKSWIGVCELISTKKKKKNRRWGMNRWTFPKSPHKCRNAITRYIYAKYCYIFIPVMQLFYGSCFQNIFILPVFDIIVICNQRGNSDEYCLTFK